MVVAVPFLFTFIFIVFHSLAPFILPLLAPLLGLPLGLPLGVPLGVPLGPVCVFSGLLPEVNAVGVVDRLVPLDIALLTTLLKDPVLTAVLVRRLLWLYNAVLNLRDLFPLPLLCSSF